jgi:hypothetical protein
MNMRRAMPALALASLLAACAPHRLPQHLHSDGSLTNRVIYAYFALAHSPYGTPPGYTQLFLDCDDEVVFVMRLEHFGPAFTVTGTLHRLDGTVDRTFRHDVAVSPPGYGRIYHQAARLAISELRAYPGAWKVRLLIDGELAGG